MPPEMSVSVVTANFRPDLAGDTPFDTELLTIQRTGTCAILPLAERIIGAQAREAHNIRYICEETRYNLETNSYVMITNTIAV